MASKSTDRKLKVKIGYQEHEKKIEITPDQCPYFIGAKGLSEDFGIPQKTIELISGEHFFIQFRPHSTLVHKMFWIVDSSSNGTIIQNPHSGASRRLRRQESYPIRQKVLVRLAGNKETSNDDVFIEMNDPDLRITTPGVEPPTLWNPLLTSLSNYQTAHLTGMAGIGKSWLANQLTDQGIWPLQLEEKLGNVLAVKIEGAEVSRDEVGLWRNLGFQMLQALCDALEERGELYHEITEQVESYISQISRENVKRFTNIIEPLLKSLYAVIEQTDLHPIFIFDDFDNIYASLKEGMLLRLYKLHQKNKKLKRRVSFILISRSSLSDLREQTSGVLKFNGLFLNSAILLSCLQKDEFNNLLASFWRNNKIVKTEYAALLYDLSGGHPALLEELYEWLSAAGLVEQPNTWAKELKRVDYLTHLSKSCLSIWDSLLYEERCALAKYATKKYTSPMITDLQNRAIIGLNGEFFSPIFKACVVGWGAQEMGLRINELERRVFVDGQDITDYIGAQTQEFKYLFYMYERRNRSCTFKELYEYLKGDKYEGNVINNKDVVVAVIGRLRGKLGKERRCISNVRAVGFKLEYH